MIDRTTVAPAADHPAIVSLESRRQQQANLIKDAVRALNNELRAAEAIGLECEFDTVRSLRTSGLTLTTVSVIVRKRL